jgi:hypothetical protein
MKRARTDDDKKSVKLARLAKEAMALDAEIEALLASMDAAEAKKLKKLTSIRDPKAQVRELDASMLEELQMLIEKYFSPRTPKNLDAILLELLRLLYKIVAKLFILQGMRPPKIDPRLLEAEPKR